MFIFDCAVIRKCLQYKKFIVLKMPFPSQTAPKYKEVNSRWLEWCCPTKINPWNAETSKVSILKKDWHIKLGVGNVIFKQYTKFRITSLCPNNKLQIQFLLQNFIFNVRKLRPLDFQLKNSQK